MRVLLYEPRNTGHRGVVLRYAAKSVRAAGWTPIVCQDNFEDDARGEFSRLLHEAKRQAADGVHVLTADNCMRRWATDFRVPLNRQVPIVCTYYLFHNLWGPLTGLAWDSLRVRGATRRVLVSDDYLDERMLPPWRRRYIRRLPDPWDPDEFPTIEQQTARSRLGFDTNWYLALVFGDLSARKGVETAVAAAANLGPGSRIKLVLAGSVHWDGLTRETVEALERRSAHGDIILHDRFIPEKDVTNYFHAADVVLCPYPRNFTVSSNTFTRGCAAGRPCLTSRHGSLGRFVSERSVGRTFASEDASDLARSLVAMCGDPRWSHRDPALSDRLRRVAAERRLPNYARVLTSTYEEMFS